MNAPEFARTPEDLERLSGLIAEILKLTGDEWRDADQSGGRAYSGASPEALREWITANVGDPFPEIGAGDDWLELLTRGLVRHSIQLRDPATAAHLHCLPLQASVAAEVLIALLNQSMDSFDQSGIATLLERHLIEWLVRECFRASSSPATSVTAITSRVGDGVFTSGGTQSNLMGLLLAREHAVMRVFGVRAFAAGLPTGAQRLRILCQAHAHFSAVQAAGLLGLGRDAVVPVAVDARGGVDVAAAVAAYETLVTEGLLPFCFFATAGTTDRGAIDDLQFLNDFCAARELWLHVDAAYGGALLFTRYRDRLRGIAGADSIAIDFHKLFFQPIACGAFLVRDAASFDCMRQHAEYLNRADDVFPNLVDRSLATTRRFDGLKLLFSLKGLGRARFETFIDRLLELTRQARDWIERDPEFTLLVEPQLTTVLFRCGDSDFCNSRVRDELLADGRAILGETRLHGRVALKLTLMNPAAQFEEIVGLFELIRRTAAKYAKATSGVAHSL